MTGNRSLDEFLGGSEDAEPADGDGPDPADAAGDGTPDEGEQGSTPDVEPIVPTSDWSPDGAACAACGATVERRWRDGEAFVCADCKDW